MYFINFNLLSGYYRFLELFRFPKQVITPGMAVVKSHIEIYAIQAEHEQLAAATSDVESGLERNVQTRIPTGHIQQDQFFLFVTQCALFLVSEAAQRQKQTASGRNRHH